MWWLQKCKLTVLLLNCLQLTISAVEQNTMNHRPALAMFFLLLFICEIKFKISVFSIYVFMFARCKGHFFGFKVSVNSTFVVRIHVSTSFYIYIAAIIGVHVQNFKWFVLNCVLMISLSKIQSHWQQIEYTWLSFIITKVLLEKIKDFRFVGDVIARVYCAQKKHKIFLKIKFDTQNVIKL